MIPPARIAAVFGVLSALTRAQDGTVPSPPAAESIEVTELPLPPVATGNCTAELNPLGTGCIGQGMYGTGFQAGGFTPDGNHIVALITYTGAPAAPDPASIYDGPQIVLIKTDGTLFPSGDAFKCITCAVPSENRPNATDLTDYPAAFQDGKRLLIGDNILDCGDFLLTSSECTPENTFMYPIRWNTTPDGSGAGGAIRELRLHPDNVHLGFNAFDTSNGVLGQHGYFSRLEFNPAPTTGEPLSPRYDLVNVTVLISPEPTPPFVVDGDQLVFSGLSINTVGELRGFSGDGKEVAYVGYDQESCNIDIFAVELATGSVRRLTEHPEYVDPVSFSADDEWFAIMDTRGSGRQMFMAGMRGVPPLIDLIATTVISSIRNNQQRRFFQPYLIDRYGDRGDYFGQQINAEGSGVPGSGAINDPEWNGRADPMWSPNGTQIVYWQDMTASPDCGGVNPLPCYNSTYQGGRYVRFMLATLTSREPYSPATVETASDAVPWGTPYVPGSSPPVISLSLPEGTYSLEGAVSGSAQVVITNTTDGTATNSVAVQYNNYTDDGLNFLNGFENYTKLISSVASETVYWYSDLERTGESYSTKKTSTDGFVAAVDIYTNSFNATGTLTTTIDGVEYLQPANYS